MTTMRAPVAYDAIQVRLTPADDRWLVETTITLRAVAHESRDLSLNVGATPLVLRSVGSADAEHSGVVDGPGSAAVVLLRLDTDRRSSWDGVQITCVFEWTPKDSGRALEQLRHSADWEAPCLVLPDMLPELMVGEDLLQGVRADALPRIHLTGTLPAKLGAAWIRNSEQPDGALVDLLHLVIFQRAAHQRGARLTASVEGASAPAANLSIRELAQARAYASILLKSLSAQLGGAGLVRPLLYLTETPIQALYFPVGAFTIQPPAHAGAKKMGAGRPENVLRQFAQGWIGGGVRISGENTIELTLGVNGALALQWLASKHPDVLGRQIAKYEAMLEQGRATGEWRGLHRHLSITLALVHRLTEAPVQERLRALIHEHWGRYLPQEIFVTELRKVGVSVPGVYM
jgi:hypothetical protein